MSYRDFTYSTLYNPSANVIRWVVFYLKEMFKNNPELEYTIYDENLNKDESFSSLLVTTHNNWEEKYRNKRPCILISRGNINFGSNGLSGSARMLSIVDNGETVTYSDLLSFPITIECLAEADLESETLASMCAAFLTMDLRPLRSINLQLMGTAIQTPPQLIEKNANTTYISSVIINVQKQRTYKARLIGNKQLEDIIMNLNNEVEMNINKD